MVLYHLTTAYQLLNCMEHRKLFHENDQAVLIIADFLTRKYPAWERLAELGFFDEIYLLPYWKMIEEGETVWDQAETLYEETVPYSLDMFEKIYCAGIQMWFSLYLIRHERLFIAFEEASGGYSRPEILMHNDERISKFRYELMLENHIYDYENPWIEAVICNMNAQTITEAKKTLIHLDPAEAFGTLPEETRERVKAFFGCPEKVETAQGSVLILTQQLANLGVVSFEKQIAIYQLFADYFFPEQKLVFKVHPDDQVYYRWLFEGAQVITEKFPSELLPFIFTNRPETIATIYSTGIYNIRHMFSESFELDMGFEASFEEIDVYWACVYIAKLLDVTTLTCRQLDGCLMDALARRQLCDHGQKPKEVSVFGGIFCEEGAAKAEEVITASDVVVFMGASYMYREFAGKMSALGEIVPVKISRRRFREKDVYLKDRDFWIFVFCKNKEDAEAVKMAYFQGLSKYSGVENEIRPETIHYELIMLKAQLRAEEERLRYYIEENKRLRAKTEGGELE